MIGKSNENYFILVHVRNPIVYWDESTLRKENITALPLANSSSLEVGLYPICYSLDICS
jgi:hypothetical protein